MKTSNMSDLLSAGADAMDNLFEVSFVFPPSWGISSSIGKKLTLRTEAFKPPSPKRPLVKIPFRSIEISKPGSTIDLDRSLSLPIRIDQDFEIYKLLIKIRDNFFAKASSEEESSIGIVVKSFKDSEDTEMHRWTFTDVIVSSVDITEYSHDDQSQPTMATVVVVYNQYTEK